MLLASLIISEGLDITFGFHLYKLIKELLKPVYQFYF